jgi:hypothetical protein
VSSQSTALEKKRKKIESEFSHIVVHQIFNPFKLQKVKSWIDNYQDAPMGPSRYALCYRKVVNRERRLNLAQVQHFAGTFSSSVGGESVRPPASASPFEINPPPLPTASPIVSGSPRRRSRATSIASPSRRRGLSMTTPLRLSGFLPGSSSANSPASTKPAPHQSSVTFEEAGASASPLPMPHSPSFLANPGLPVPVDPRTRLLVSPVTGARTRVTPLLSKPIPFTPKISEGK